MSLFKKAENESAYLKAALFGFQGSGKTFTACEIARGLYKYLKLEKPIFFLDTETGSDWSINFFKNNEIELFTSKTRAFKDLIEAVKEAEKNSSILIIDSVTHFWNEMTEAYKLEKGLSRLTLNHWGILIPEWNRFTTLLVNSKLHIICCGRAGWEWGDKTDEDGFNTLTKLGTKMKAQSEFGFEPHLVLEMERTKGKEVGDKILHTCYVVKDRNMSDKTLDGASFQNPVFDNFLPHINELNIGGIQKGFDESRNSKELFAKNGESWSESKKRKSIVIEEINGLLEINFNGQTKEVKQTKAALKKKFLGTYSDSQIEELPIETLNYALLKITDIIQDLNRQNIINEIILELTTPKEIKNANDII